MSAFDITYDAALKSYILPITGIESAYTPKVYEIEEKGSSVILSVGYINNKAWAQVADDGYTTPEPDKYMKITLRERSGGMYVASIQAVDGQEVIGSMPATRAPEIETTTEPLPTQPEILTTAVPVTDEALAKHLNKFLASLSKKNRVIFMSRYWYAMPIKQIADEMDMSEGAVKVSLLRKIRHLALPHRCISTILSILCLLQHILTYCLHIFSGNSYHHLEMTSLTGTKLDVIQLGMDAVLQYAEESISRIHKQRLRLVFIHYRTSGSERTHVFLGQRIIDRADTSERDIGMIRILVATIK
jgi:RNA polymerase sigma factor (sigma-70 family)